ncbi:ankyrin repeat domain-containing protein [Armatimonas sp.]|uniref:ankyrin repeat domain-containing protein n=1 Tax=Armatimonas sp. TaxID=1872638 RepID=UPI00374DDDDA
MNWRYLLVILLLVLTSLVVVMTSNLPHRPMQLIYLTSQEKQDRELIVAIHEQATERALALLKAGANPNARGYWDPRGRWDDLVHQRVWEPRRNTDGPTALMLAAFADDIAVTKALLERGADVNAAATPEGIGTSALFTAVSYGRPEIAKLLLDHGATVRPSADGETPLYYALMLGDTKLVGKLIERGIPVNMRDPRGNMPLHEAASRGDAAMLRLLLTMGADPDARNAAGFTPLHLVVSIQNSGHGIHIPPDAQRQSVVVLLKHKANRLLRIQGKTALQIAEELHHTDLARLLQSGL